MELDECVQIFASESKELLEDMESALIGLEKKQNDPELINQIFRAVHTIKGSAGLFGFEDIIEFTHVVENVLDDIRNCLISVNTDIINIIFQCKDQINLYIEALISESQVDEEESKRLAELLKTYQNGEQEQNAAEELQADSSCPLTPFAETNEQDETSDKKPAEKDHYFHISFYLGEDSFRHGFSPKVILDQLRDIGEIISVTPHLDHFPNIENYCPDACYLGWFIIFNSDKSKQEIAEVFEFLDESSYHILPPETSVADFQKMISELPEDEYKAIGQMLIDIGSLTEKELNDALKANLETGELTGKILVSQGDVQAELVETALKKQAQVKQTKKNAISLIRIDASKLDTLVNLVGEMVISCAKTGRLIKKYSDEELTESASEMTETLEEMREVVLGLRMIQLTGTFNKFHRVVRDISSKLGKQINLEISGGETELDKSVIDQISDPLTHIIRNSIDHGVEMPEERISAGKESVGKIKLQAFHETGAICIKVSDDGRGINRNLVIEKAVRKGLIDSNKKYSDKEILNMIFEPGFSTASEITDISGRGVGMDVVKKNIESLRGTIDISSDEGKGTEIKIILPLTLAIIEGFNIGVADQSYIIPLDMVVECISVDDLITEEIHRKSYIKLRDEVLPLIDLQQFLALDEVTDTGKSRKNIVVVSYSGKKAGLIVDALYGEIQTVIKPLGRIFEGIAGFAGFTILGSGSVALIIDIPALINNAITQEHKYFNELSATTKKVKSNNEKIAEV
ncbi:MAG: chemotaxis protein CheA [Gammaproteobacteria bacterium]|nr:MAG: chemotaxis protein CheA [Gammaproteobacteria bacterium]